MTTTVPPDRRILPLLCAVAAITAVVLTIFAWPQARSEPRELPVGVAGEGVAAAQLEATLTARGFAVDRFRRPAEARQAILDRQLYGAFVAARNGGVRLLTAPAASPAVAGLLEEVVSTAPPVFAVAPGSADDPRGAGFSASVLPLILSGVLAGVLVWWRGAGTGRTIALLLGAAATAGLAAVATLQSWLGVITGGWLLNAAVLALLVLAIAATVTGLMRLLGAAGASIGALLFVLLGNPWSGISSAPELLPQPLGTIGQLLPPGAGAELLRGAAFFDGALATGALAVLVAWVAIGIGALLVAARRESTRAGVQASSPGLR